MSSESAIKVSDVGKCYPIYKEPRDRLKQFVMPRLLRIFGAAPRQYFREFWALRGVSFEVKKGETVGIVGRNGSGKSTLLQMICGTLTPTRGNIITRGRIAALLELGSGFNLEFSGRENVYMNASLLGLAKDEIDVRFDKIVEFADIGEFIEQPVKAYSSGMMLRLAFAVQAQVDPDILIVDEALAVGDAKFQARCFERLKQLKERGTSILLVTHSTEQIVTHCSRAVLLDHGLVVEQGDPNLVVNRYMDLLFGKTQKQHEPQNRSVTSVLPSHNQIGNLKFEEDIFFSRPGYNPLEYRWGDGAGKITDFYFFSGNQAYPAAVDSGQKIILEVALQFVELLYRPIFGISIKTKEGVTVYGTNTELLEVEEFKSKGGAGQAVAIKVDFVCRLAPGDYFISLGLATREGEKITPHDRRYDCIHFHVSPVTTFFGLIDADLNICIESIA